MESLCTAHLENDPRVAENTRQLQAELDRMHGKPAPLELRYLDTPPTPTRWLVGGLIPEESCVVLGAEEKKGKSWLAFLLAICVATGTRLLGRFEPRRTGPVLIYSPESGWNARTQRVWGLCLGLGLDPREVCRSIPFVAGRLDLATERSLADLRATIAQVEPVLLVLDPLITCYLDRDENSSGEVQPVLNGIRDLTSAAPGLSVLLAHHLGKGNRERGPFAGLRGSSALGAWSDGLISLRAESDEWDATRRLDAVHRDAPSPTPVGFRIVTVSGEEGEPDRYRLLPVEAPEIGARKPRPETQKRRNQLCAEVCARPGEYTAETLAKRFNLGVRTTQGDIEALIDTKRLERGFDRKLRGCP